MKWAFENYEAVVAHDRETAVAQLRRYEPAVVTMDLGLPPHPDDPTEGLKLLEQIHSLLPETKVIVLTGQNDRANALRAISLGAHDFCTKPFEPDLLSWTIDRAFRVHELQEENRRLQSSHDAPAMSGIITRDPTRRRPAGNRRRRARGLRHASESQEADRDRHFPRRSVLPAGRDHRRDPAAARTARRCDAARACLRPPFRRGAAAQLDDACT